jgi:hypothetical protein
MTETNAKIDAKTVNLVDRLFDPYAKDMQEVLEELYNRLEALHDDDVDAPLMQELMEIIFSNLPSEDGEARVYSLRNAAEEIAAQIDEDAKSPCPAYHNRKHFMFVQLAGRAIDSANIAFYNKFSHETSLPQLTSVDLACHAMANLTHDIGHPGGTNGSGKDYQPMKLEKESLARARPILERHYTDPRDLKMIETIVKSTDPGLPHKIMIAAYDFHFNPRSASKPEDWLGKFDQFDTETQRELQDLVDSLYSDAKTTFLAASMGDADLLPSFGISEERNLKETEKLDREFENAGLARLLNEQGEVSRAAQLFALLSVVGTRIVGDHHRSNFRTPGAHALGSDTAQHLQLMAEEKLDMPVKEKVYQAVGLQLIAA